MLRLILFLTAMLVFQMLACGAPDSGDTTVDHILKHNRKNTCADSAPSSAATPNAPNPGTGSGITHCRIYLNSYSQVVHVFIPRKLMKAQRVPLLIHFHGHNGDQTAEAAHFSKPTGDFEKWLSESERKTILVVPESEGSCSTYDHELASDKAVTKFVSELESTLGVEPTTLALSGHSGAYRTIARIGDWKAKASKTFLKNLAAVGLFDAVYGNVTELAGLARVLDKQKELFWVVFDAGGSTQEGEDHLDSALKVQPRPWQLHSVDTCHHGICIWSVENVEHANMLMDHRFTSFINAWLDQKRRKRIL